MKRDQIVLTDGLNTRSNTKGESVDFNDLYNSFKLDWQINSSYTISFTLTYTRQFKEAYNLAKMKHYIEYYPAHGNNQWYVIQQIEDGLNETGQPTLQITANHILIDLMKNLRIDPRQPTEDNPDVSGSGSDDSSAGDDTGDNQQPGTTVTVKQTDVQQTYTLEEQLHKFVDGNNQGVKLAISGNFPKMPAEATGSLYEWLGSNLASYGAFWVPDGNTLKVYDMQSLQHRTDTVFRYLNNMTTANLQSDGNDLVNDCWVYGGKVEKDITTVTASGGVSNGITGAINGDWTQAIKNAAAVSGIKVSDADVNKIKGQIRLESSGREDAKGGTDGLADGPALGLLQFKQGTFNYYCRPPYTNIMKGFDQLIAFFNIPNAVGQISGGLSGWSPHGAPISKATIEAKPATDNSWGWPFPSTGEGHFSGGQLFGVQPGGGFRQNGFHDGLDFGSVDHPGSEVHAVHGGTVTSIAWGGSEIMWYVVITDSSGLNCEYQEAFINRNNVSVSIGQHINTGDVIGVRTNNHLHLGITRASIPGAFSKAFTNDGTWLDPLAIIKNGGAPSGGTSDGDDSGTTSSTTSESYYSLYYHYVDKDSQKRYGSHVGAPIIQDSIYDMDTLKSYVANTVKHDPPTSLTTTIDGWHNLSLGNQMRVVAPESNLKTWVTLMGISGNPFNPTQAPELTYQNTGLALKSFIYAMAQDLHQINQTVTQNDTGVSIGTKQEDHFAGESTKKDDSRSPKYSKKQMDRLAEFMNGKDVTLDGR